MVYDTSIIERAIITGFQDRIADPVPALIGNPATRDIVVEDVDTPGLIWVHTLGVDKPSAFMARYGNTLSAKEFIYGMPVSIQVSNGHWKILEFDTLSIGSFMDGYTAAHDQQPVLIDQLFYGTMIPTPPVASMSITLVGAFVNDNRMKTQNTGDFSTGTVQDTSAANITEPAAGYAKGILVQVNPESNEISYKQGAEFPDSIPHALAFDGGYYPAKDRGMFRYGWVKWIEGATQLTFDHLYQRQDLYTISPSGNIPLTLTGDYTVPTNEQQFAREVTIPDGKTLSVADGGLLVFI